VAALRPSLVHRCAAVVVVTGYAAVVAGTGRAVWMLIDRMVF
jgi:hypothetical protein